MIKVIISAIITALISIGFPAYADSSGRETYTVTIPEAIVVNNIGIISHTTPDTISNTEQASFSQLVRGTNSGTSWKLTTNTPVGISVTYNQKGYIMAKFASLTNENGYSLKNIDIYPSRVVFNTIGDIDTIERVFKFNPIITVSKSIPPGTYTGKIIFTVVTE